MEYLQSPNPCIVSILSRSSVFIYLELRISQLIGYPDAKMSERGTGLFFYLNSDWFTFLDTE